MKKQDGKKQANGILRDLLLQISQAKEGAKVIPGSCKNL
jgi:hypothetical protein